MVVFTWCSGSLEVVGLGDKLLPAACSAVAVQLLTLQRLLVCVWGRPGGAGRCSCQPGLTTGHRAVACLCLRGPVLFACMTWQLVAPWLGWLCHAVQVHGASAAAAQPCTDPHCAHIARAQAFWSALFGCTAQQQQPGNMLLVCFAAGPAGPLCCDRLCWCGSELAQHRPVAWIVQCVPIFWWCMPAQGCGSLGASVAKLWPHPCLHGMQSA